MKTFKDRLASFAGTGEQIDIDIAVGGDAESCAGFIAEVIEVGEDYIEFNSHDEDTGAAMAKIVARLDDVLWFAHSSVEATRAKLMRSFKMREND